MKGEVDLTLTDPDRADIAPSHDWYPDLALAFLVVALVCGGSSSSPVSAGIVRVCAVPALALSVWRMAWRPTAPGAIWPLIILIAATMVIITQLIPLAPGVWRALPGRRIVVDTYRAAEIAPPWLPISLTPTATWDAILGLIPPTTMFCATLALDPRGRRMLVAAVLGVALASVCLGMMQVAGGKDSPLRIYAITNADSAVGFFANRNHQGAFLASTLPFAAYLAARSTAREGARAVFQVAAAIGFTLVIVAGAAVTGSRAGLMLIGLGGAGAVMVAARARARSPGGMWRFAALASPAVVAIGAAGLVLLAVDPALEHAVEARFGPELRFELNPEMAKAGLDFAPTGSGAGSFAKVYQLYERTSDMTPAFVNHAHDDFVEVWLDAGWAGVALIMGFVAWWTAATWSTLRQERGRDAALSLAGSLIVGMLLIHSLVDYPLRTPALATLFAFACGLILPAPRHAADGGRGTMI